MGTIATGISAFITGSIARLILGDNAYRQVYLGVLPGSMVLINQKNKELRLEIPKAVIYGVTSPLSYLLGVASTDMILKYFS